LYCFLAVVTVPLLLAFPLSTPPTPLSFFGGRVYSFYKYLLGDAIFEVSARLALSNI
jgi:hypothetical protein